MHQSLQQPPKQSPNQTANGNCYRCSKPGHWAKDCPQTGQSPFKNRSPLNNWSPVFHPTSTFDLPPTHCPCGAGLCEIRVSHSSANPDRRYYCCPGKFEYHCEYFKWCDRLKGEEILEVQPKPYPTCGCGAGVCAVLKENGHTYYICPIKKGYGACNFRQLMEEDQESYVFSPEAIMQIDNVINRSLARRALDFSSEEVQGQMVNGVDGSSGIAHEMSLRSSDALHSVNIAVNVLESEKKTEIKDILLNMGDTLVKNVEASVTTTIVPAENQFSPDKTPSKGGFKSDEVLPKQTLLMKDGRNEDRFVTDAVLQASEKLSKFSLNELITLLESVGSKNHKNGMMECYTYAGLDCLQLDDNGLLHLLLTEYIPQVAALSCIEQDINNDISVKLLDHNKNGKACFKEIFHAFCEAGKAYMASNERLNSLRKNSSCGGVVLDVLEDELWCCEVENDTKRDKLLQITKTMSQCMQGELAGCV